MFKIPSILLAFSFCLKKWHVQYVIELGVYFCVGRLERILTILCVCVCARVFVLTCVTYSCFCVHKRGGILSYSNGNLQTPFLYVFDISLFSFW